MHRAITVLMVFLILGLTSHGLTVPCLCATASASSADAPMCCSDKGSSEDADQDPCGSGPCEMCNCEIATSAASDNPELLLPIVPEVSVPDRPLLFVVSVSEALTGRKSPGRELSTDDRPSEPELSRLCVYRL